MKLFQGQYCHDSSHKFFTATFQAHFCYRAYYTLENPSDKRYSQDSFLQTLTFTTFLNSSLKEVVSRVIEVG